MAKLFIITGVTGFVGNVLAKTLIDKGYKVRGLARSKEKVQHVFSSYLNKIEIVYGDVRKEEDLERLFDYSGKMFVIHTAALISIDSKKIDEYMYSINVLGTKNIVDACKKHQVKKFIYISSSNAIKANINGLIKEPDIYDEKGIDGYGKTKAIASQIVLDAIKNGLNATILHPSAIIGPGDYSSTHITQLINDFLNHKLPVSVKGGYNFIDVRDIVDIILQIIEKNPKCKNYLITGEYTSITNLLNVVASYKNMKKIKTVPCFLAYLGLPFIFVFFKLKKKKPLYTLYSLKTIQDKEMFDSSRLKEEFNYMYRNFEESIIDQIIFLENCEKKIEKE